LQRANAFKSEILGTVAHDLKNPLSVILGRTEMLTEMISRAAFSPENIKAQVNHIRDSANRMTSMVNNLIADAMADALDINVRPELVDVTALVNEIATANQPLAEGKRQVITVSAPADCPTTCDADRIREAIENLVSNAIKYSPIGGHIELLVGRIDGETQVRVRDEGAGLSPEDRTRLFERFQRLSAKPTGGESSTGLGLSIAKRIVELHGGTIHAESAGPGRGTTFTMRLPAP
jgi:signal transduction histidine kinase